MKDILILGIESSCDETSVSVIKNGREVSSNVINSQIKIHEEYGGVVPEIASRCHTEVINGVMKEALKEAKVTLEDIDGIAVTEGHIAGNYLTHKDLEPPFLCLIVSGGHTHLVNVTSYNDFEILGKTRDDAIGEAFDKVARVVGLRISWRT